MCILLDTPARIECGQKIPWNAIKYFDVFMKNDVDDDDGLN